MKTTIKSLRGAIALITVLLITGNVEAAILSGDFRTESDLPYCCDRAGPLVYENIGAAVGAGEELTGANFVQNPSNWGGGVVHMDLDPLTNILTLHSQDIWDFETFDAWITNIVFDAGERITGLSLISQIWGWRPYWIFQIIVFISVTMWELVIRRLILQAGEHNFRLQRMSPLYPFLPLSGCSVPAWWGCWDSIASALNR
jgi:hypothetical protein